MIYPVTNNKRITPDLSRMKKRSKFKFRWAKLPKHGGKTITAIYSAKVVDQMRVLVQVCL